MKLLRRCLSELAGLFVDDGAHAAMILAWVVACCMLFRQWPGALWTGPVLFAGLAAIFPIGLGRGPPR